MFGRNPLRKIVCLIVGMSMILVVPGWAIGQCVGDGGAVAYSSPQPSPLLAYKESSSGLNQPGMEGGETEIEAADIDSDGDLDLMSIGDHGNPDINTNEHGVMVWFNDGTGKWSIYQNGDWGYGGIAIGDMNNDGKWDIAYSMHHNYSKNDLGDQVQEAATGDGTGKNWAPWGTGLGVDGQEWGMMGTDFGDFNNDGWLDIGATSFGCCDGVHTYLNNHDGTWKHTGIQKGGNGDYPDNFEFADFNDDGNLDLITANEMGPIFFGDGKGGWTLKSSGINGQGGGGSAGDVNNDGYADYANIGSSGAPQVYLWDNSSQSWKSSNSGLNGTTYARTDLSDMDNDGNLDLVAIAPNTISVWKGNGAGAWSLAASIPLSGSQNDPEVLRASGDFDHNGYNDIAILLGRPNVPHVYLNDASAQPSATLSFPRGGERFYPGSVRFVDYTFSPSGTVKLELSTTGNTGPWTPIVDNYKDGGRYQWTIPNTPSKNCYIKVTAGSSSGMNAKPFEILGSSGPAPVVIQVGAPNGGENWTVGSQHDVTYTISGGKSPFDVTLEYSVTGASGPWKAITTQSGVAGSGKYTWTIPNDPSVDAFVKASVKDAAQQTGNDASNAKFEIYGPTILPVLQYVSIDPSTDVTLDIGGKQTFTAKAYNPKGVELKAATLTWTTSGGIGSVSLVGGPTTAFTATTAGTGEVEIMASYSGKDVSNSTKVTVNEPGKVPSLDRVEIVPPSVSGDIGKFVSLTAKAYDTNGTDITDSVTFTWTLGTTGLAELKYTGKSASLTLKAVGETTVQVEGKYNGVTRTKTASVKITKPQTEFPWWIFMVIIAVVAIIVVLMFILGRRKKKQQPYEWGGAGPQW